MLPAMTHILSILIATQLSAVEPKTVHPEEMARYTSTTLRLDSAQQSCSVALAEALRARTRYELFSDGTLNGAPEEIVARFRGEWRAFRDYMVEVCRDK